MKQNDGGCGSCVLWLLLNMCKVIVWGVAVHGLCWDKKSMSRGLLRSLRVILAAA
jgi:hypothetical protein